MVTHIFNGYAIGDFGASGSLTTGNSYTVPADVTRTFAVEDPGGAHLSGDNDTNEQADDSTQSVTVHDTNGPEETGDFFAEYRYVVEDGFGTQYNLIHIEIEGTGTAYLAWEGTAPPPGTTVTVLSRDSTVDQVPYSSFSYAPGVVCFAEGTRILTPQGLRPVERLTPGTRVLDGAGRLRRLLWSGSTRFILGSPSDPRQPVRLKAGSLDGVRPWRDLLLSKQHRVLLHGACVRAVTGNHRVLAPACGLTALPGIDQDGRSGTIRYHHVLLDRHAVVIAEGVACESFWPGPQALSTLPPPDRADLAAILAAASRNVL